MKKTEIPVASAPVMASVFDRDHSRRARWIGTAGWLIILLSAGAALLPVVGLAQGAAVIGGMLITSGVVEFLAALFRSQTRKLAMLAGMVTFVAGLLFSAEPATKFMPMLYIIAGWLALRSIVLGVAWALEHGSVRFWTGLAAATDFILAVTVTIGISIATLVVALFGPTPPLIAHFTWILAISFVATGSMLLEVASCARRGDA
jgi:uncharacterized membrane protein HdeD (DUF308 family)